MTERLYKNVPGLPGRMPGPTSRRCMVIVIALVVCIGCGQDRERLYPVSGRVAFADGTPLTQGMVVFDSVAENAAVGARGVIGSDGAFRMGTRGDGDGVPAGRYRVAIAIPARNGDTGAVNASGPAIAPRFAAFESSGLEFTVEQNRANDYRLSVE
jgi:hypothetical protein